MIATELSNFETSEGQRFTAWQLLLVLLFSQVILLFLSEYLLLDDALYFEYFSDKLSYEKIQSVIKEGWKWKWISYVVAPIVTLLKCFSVALFLYGGVFFFNRDAGFSSLFRITIGVEFIWLLPMIFKIVWFGIFHRNYTLEELTNFQALSLMVFFERDQLDAWIIYPLLQINLFEITYWVALAFAMKTFFDKTLRWRLQFIALTYGLMFFIWIFVVMFLIISLT